MSEKICSKCKQPKSINQFHRDKRRPDGHLGVCSFCRSSVPLTKLAVQEMEELCSESLIVNDGKNLDSYAYRFQSPSSVKIVEQQIDSLKQAIKPTLYQIAVLEQVVVDLKSLHQKHDLDMPPLSVKAATLYVMEREVGPWDSQSLANQLDSTHTVNDSKHRRRAIGVALNDLYMSKKIVRVERGQYTATTFAKV